MLAAGNEGCGRSKRKRTLKMIVGELSIRSNIIYSYRLHTFIFGPQVLRDDSAADFSAKTVLEV